MPNIGDGDEIVVSIMEHDSNIVPWRFIRERQGAKLVLGAVDDDGAFHLDDFEKSLTDRTKLVAITHMSMRSAPSSMSRKCAGSRTSAAFRY